MLSCNLPLMTPKMSDSENEECSSEEILLKQHRKEKKDLQAKIQGLKKAASKGDKKKKKETNEEIAKLESEMDLRHEQELADLKKSEASNPSKEIEDVTRSLHSTDLNETSSDLGDQQGKDRVSKAQKRREKKEQKEKERQLEIEQQDEQNKLGLRHLEAQKLKELLKKRHLSIQDITSDGDCLYKSVSHQLKITSGVTQSVVELRRSVADIMRQNPDEYLPFLSNPKTGEALSEMEYDKYCQDLVSKPVWGGQVELRALTEVLGHPIEVIQAEGPTVLIGEEFAKSGKLLLITYHRHYFGLGEHYNSTKPEQKDESDDD